MHFETKMWKKIFSMIGPDIDSNKPLSPKVLADPNHNLVKTLIYIYSMESFIFSEMNKASRMKDESKIKFYGAFASALGFIIHCGNHKGANLDRDFKVYRGLQMTKEELELRFGIDTTINLQGFTSTSLSKERALGFALRTPKPNNTSLEDSEVTVPILLEITFKGSHQFFSLNSSDYSSYPCEQEVLLQEGIKYRVCGIE